MWELRCVVVVVVVIGENVRSKISETEKQNFYIDFLDLKQRKTSYEPFEGKIYVIDCVLLKRKEGKALICYKS